ncbi:hypothetical protein, partial [Enterococcus faecalis]|uniref:hypothetical protein n=1 Tax=Enterococcus faecalis TaxID=1351 RepID=UPI00403F378C
RRHRFLGTPRGSGYRPAMAIVHDPAAAPLGAGFHAVAPGDLACVVTALAMDAPPAALRRLQPEPDVPIQMVRWADPEPE